MAMIKMNHEMLKLIHNEDHVIMMPVVGIVGLEFDHHCKHI